MYANVRPAGDSEDSDSDGYTPNSTLKHLKYNFVSKNNEDNLIKACSTEDKTEILLSTLTKYNVNNFFYTGWTPLLYASYYARADVIEILINFDVDPNKHKDGYAPIHALCDSPVQDSKAHSKCLKLFIASTANFDAITKLKETPLMLACKSKTVNFITEILKYIQNIDARDTEGRTALMYATIANKYDIVLFLVSNNVDIHIADKHHMTAGSIALQKGFKDIHILLTNKNTKSNNSYVVTDVQGWKDLFPSHQDLDDKLDGDIEEMLSSMGLQEYFFRFIGKSTKSFTESNEANLVENDINVYSHRRRILSYLLNFHCQPWDSRSLGVINKPEELTLYDGILCLGNSARHCCIITSSYNFIIKNINFGDKNTECPENFKESCLTEINHTKVVISNLKKELSKLEALSIKIGKEQDLSDGPACYIGPIRKKKYFMKILSIALIGTFLIHKTFAKMRL